MTVNGLKMGLETPYCFQPVLPCQPGRGKDAGCVNTKKKDTQYACLSFGGEGGIRILGRRF